MADAALGATPARKVAPSRTDGKKAIKWAFPYALKRGPTLFLNRSLRSATATTVILNNTKAKWHAHLLKLEQQSEAAGPALLRMLNGF